MQLDKINLKKEKRKILAQAKKFLISSTAREREKIY